MFNGGPGGGSASLDADFLGPRSFDENAPPSTSKLPLIDNPNTLLDKTDLVFVDPVGTGYSMAIKPYSNQQFWASTVMPRSSEICYINVNNRQSSPKYVYGVSYSGIPASSEPLTDPSTNHVTIESRKVRGNSIFCR